MANGKCPSLDHFCYCCGCFTSLSNRRHMSENFIALYRRYFDQPLISDWYVPMFACKTCCNKLLGWIKTAGQVQMNFGVPMVWSTPKEGKHTKENCYGCVNYVAGLNMKAVAKTEKHIYISVPSAQTTIPFGGNIQHKMPTPDAMSSSTLHTRATENSEETVGHSLFEPSTFGANDPVLITQDRLDYFIVRLELSKRSSEEFASLLREDQLLAPGTKVTAYRNRQAGYQNFFFVNDEKTYAYCNNAHALMRYMHEDIDYRAEDWRLFIDSSKASLKTVLLHKKNKIPAIPLAYSTETSETYTVLQKILDDIEYEKEDHQWRICCDLKVVAMLQGLQGGYTKHMCFICDWNTRYKGNQYKMLNWELRGEHREGQLNVKWPKLVDSEKVILPPLHIKLGIVKSYIKTVYKTPEVAERLKEIFPGISVAKLEQGVLNGPDIRKLMKTDSFDAVLEPPELEAWQSVKGVCEGVLGKNRAPHYERLVQKMMKSFEIIGVNMSLKIHFLHFHLDVFSRQLSTESDEQGERYHQVAMPFEKRYLIIFLVSVELFFCKFYVV